MKRMLLPLIALSLALTCLAEPADAAVMYKWVDENGTVHYGERPPTGVDATPVSGEKLSTVSVPTPAPAPEAATGVEPGAEPEEEKKSIGQQRREERAVARALAEAEQRQLDVNCEAMRQQLAWVEPNPRVLVQDPDGTTRRMDDDERMALVKQAKDFIEKNDCP